MSNTLSDSLKIVVLGALLSGCGLAQRVGDSTAETGRAIFYTQVKTLHLDFSARPASNTDTTDMHDLSVSTLLRVYQLRDDKTLLRTDYDNLVSAGRERLKADLLDEHAVLVRPHGGVQLQVPLHADTRFVAIVGLFRQPDNTAPAWRLVLARDELEPDRARIVELGDNRLELRAPQAPST